MTAAPPAPERTRRAADLRLLLPAPPDTVALLGSAAGTAPAWRATGAQVVPEPDREVDLVVTDAGAGVRAALARARSAVVLLGWPGLPVHGAPGWTARRYLVQGDLTRPRWLLPTDARVRRYFGRTGSRPPSTLGQLRNAAVASPLGHAVPRLVVLTRDAGAPYALRAAAVASALPAPDAWAFQLGDGDDLQRAVAYAFRAGDAAPSWVLKLSRTAGAPPRGAREATVLRLLAERAPRAAAHVVPVLGGLQLHGSLATVEQAAVGSTLAAHLLTAPQALRRRATDSVVHWTAELARETTRSAAGPAAVAAVVDRTLRSHGCAELAARFARSPAVFAHNDLGTWNVLADARGFTVLDWESADPAGLPLWDLAYFATDALSLVHGPADEDDRLHWCRRLWRGEVPQSALLAAWVRAATRAAGLSDDAAAALVTASWLHHGLSQGRRAQWVGGLEVADGYLGRLGAAWLADPALGVDWPGLHPGSGRCAP